MIFAEFYHLSTGYPSYTAKDIKPIPACGSDSVLVIDGRLSRDNMHYAAIERCISRGYIGYTLNSGESFTRGREFAKYRGVS